MAVLFPPDLNPVSPESVELVDDATTVFSPSMARGNMQRLSFGDPRWRITRKYSAVRAEDKARLSTILNGARGRFETVRTVPGYVQRGSFPSQELFANPTFANGTTGWSSEAAWTVSVKDKVLRSQRNQSGGTAFFALPTALSGLTQYGIYIARFFIRLGGAFDSTTFTVRIDDYSTLSGVNQLFKSMQSAIIVPKTTSARPAIAQLLPVAFLAEGGAYVDVQWASFTRCALVDAGNNMVLFSDTFSDSSWTKVLCSVGVNVAAAPDGSITADSLLEDNSAGAQHFIQTANLAIPAGTGDLTASFYVKAGARTWCHLAIVEFTGPSQAGVYFNLATGVIGSAPNGANMVDCRGAITALGSGWYRISVTARNTNNATVIQPHLYLASSDGITAYDGNGSAGILVWRGGITPGSAASIPNQTIGVANPGSQFKTGYVRAKGLPASVNGTLLSGDYIEINGELKRLTAPVNSDANGNAIIHFRPAMVNPPLDNDPIIIGNPMGRFLASNMKWDSQWGIQEDANVTLDEVYE